MKNKRLKEFYWKKLSKPLYFLDKYLELHIQNNDLMQLLKKEIAIRRSSWSFEKVNVF